MGPHQFAKSWPSVLFLFVCCWPCVFQLPVQSNQIPAEGVASGDSVEAAPEFQAKACTLVSSDVRAPKSLIPLNQGIYLK